VDNSPVRWRLGVVVPKRHARRAVTRSMLKRLLRAGFDRRRDTLSPGLWLVRLRAPFAPASFVSADSPALRGSAAAEFDALLRRAGALSPHAA
jgi:ribonuclease P protein component